MFHDYSRLGRWEEVEDVMQSAVIRLLQALIASNLRRQRSFFDWRPAKSAGSCWTWHGTTLALKVLRETTHRAFRRGIRVAGAVAGTGQQYLDPVRLAEWTEFTSG